MVYPTCIDADIYSMNDGTVKCSTGWVFEQVPEASTGSINGIDYLASGAYFGAAFTAAAVIVLSAKLAARLLTFLRR